MRLLYLTDRLSVRGGADHHLAEVIRSAAASGHRVTVAYGRRDSKPPVSHEVERVRVRGLSSLVDSSAGLGTLRDLVDGHDLIHVQNVMNPSALGVATRTGRAIVTVQDHRVFCPGPGKTLPDGTACDRPMGEKTCAECLPGADYRERTVGLTGRRLEALRGAVIVVLSRYMADEMAAMGFDEIVILPPWVEPGPTRTGPGATFVLGGRLVAHKGVEAAWRSWHEAGRPLPLVVAGAGPLEGELGGAHRVGWLEPMALRRELRRARALLFPARWQEPFGILGVEALAEGTPVVVAQSGGTDAWSAAGCVRVPPGDIRAMAGALTRLANDPEHALAMGRAGQEAVKRRFNRASLEPRLHELYRRVSSAAPLARAVHQVSSRDR